MLKDIAPRDWGAFLISLIILAFFGLYEYSVLLLKIAPNETLSGILNNLVILVSGYWIGSSSGSKNKDAVIAQAATASQAETAKESNGNGKAKEPAPTTVVVKPLVPPTPAPKPQ